MKRHAYTFKCPNCNKEINEKIRNIHTFTCINKNKSENANNIINNINSLKKYDCNEEYREKEQKEAFDILNRTIEDKNDDNVSFNQSNNNNEFKYRNNNNNKFNLSLDLLI